MRPFRWWANKFLDEPGGALIILTFVVTVIAVAAAWIWGVVSPERAIIVAPFEVASGGQTRIALTGKTISSMLVDEMKGLGEEAKLYVRERASVYEASIGANEPTPAIEQVPESSNLGVEVSGFSVARIKAELKRIRQEQHTISGDALFTPEGLLLRARMDEKWNWALNPFPSTGAGLESACRELALEILALSNPEVAGLIRQKQGNLDEAVRVYQNWLDHGLRNTKERATVQFLLGVAFDLKGDYQAAINSYEKAISLRANYPGALKNLGLSFYQKDDMADAAKAYGVALSYDPADAVTWVHYGNVLFKIGRLNDAINAYTSARDLAPGVALIRYNLATLLNRAGRQEEANRERVEFDRLSHSDNKDK